MAFTSRRFLGTFQGLFALIVLLAAVRPAKAQTSYDFVPVTPCRIADTRNPNGSFGGPSLASGGTRSFPIPSSSCGIPSSAAAYSLNVTVVPSGLVMNGSADFTIDVERHEKVETPPSGK